MESTSTVIHKNSEVWTKDGVNLGDALHLYHRLEEINPELQYYATYLETFSFQSGERHYIPTDYLQQADGGNGRLTVNLTHAQVEHNTWNRKPSFIASGKARREELEELLVQIP
jgi:hypothetical protein